MSAVRMSPTRYVPSWAGSTAGRLLVFLDAACPFPRGMVRQIAVDEIVNIRCGTDRVAVTLGVDPLVNQLFSRDASVRAATVLQGSRNVPIV